MRRLLPGLVGIITVVGPGLADTVRGFSVHDLVVMERLSDPRVSPDARQVVFVRRQTDLEEDKGLNDLWLVGIDGGDPRRLTRDGAGASNPRWSPDGAKIYFLSSRSGSSQVWSISAAGGEAQQVTDLPLEVGNLVVSPDGASLAVTMDVDPDCDSPTCTRERLDAEERDQSSGRLYERIFVRHWDRWKQGRRSHLFVVPTAGGEPRDLTLGFDADVPSRPFGGPEEIAFTPDGQGLVFTMRDAGRGEPWSTDFDLYLVPIDGSEKARCLTESNEAWDTRPVFSPDGRTLAYLAMSRSGYEADRFRVMLRDWSTGETRALTEDWDYSASEIVFSAGGGTLLVTAADRGQVSLFAIETATGSVTRLVGEGHVRSPGVAGERIVFGLDHLRSPVDLYSIELEGGESRRLTELNAERLAEVAMGEPEQFSFAGWNDETVYAWVVKPVGFDPDRRYPVAFLIHGGPQGSFGNDFHYRWNPQVYAGAGYAAVMVDFHGSTGYGQGFTDSIRGDWGGKPLEDLQKGLAAGLERYPWLDSDRVCALGASYGGYMVDWIAGNWPDRFRCLVNHDGIFDQRMMYYATEELWFPEWEHGGPYWLSREGFERHNPANHVDRWQTPMLVIHGELDYRVPVTQGLATFTALQRRGIPSQLLYFPDENHWVLRPSNSILWHDTVLAWLARWTGAPEGAGSAR